MLEAQARIVGVMEQLRSLHAGRAVVLVSHGDVIKAALLYHVVKGKVTAAQASMLTSVISAREVLLKAVITS